MKIKLSQTQIEDICFPFFNDIQENKFQVYLTYGGNVAVVLNRRGGGNAPLVGAYYTSDSTSEGEWISCKWMADGSYPSINDHLKNTKLDLRMSQQQNKDTA